MFDSKAKLMKHLILLTMIATLLSACGKSTPSAANAKSEFEKDGSNEEYSYSLHNGSMRLDSLKKINGQAREVMGIKLYQIEYQAVLVSLEDKEFRPGCGKNFGVGMGDIKCGGYKVGDKLTIQDKMMFEMTEKGWKGPSGAIY